MPHVQLQIVELRLKQLWTFWWNYCTCVEGLKIMEVDQDDDFTSDREAVSWLYIYSVYSPFTTTLS